MKSYLNEYKVHKSNAAYRGIAFLLTYEEWFQIWQDSGHWFERGRGANKYVMARFGDIGPYAIGNVKIITGAENVSEGNLGKILSDETKRLMSITNVRVISQKQKDSVSARHKGKKLSKEHASALRNSNLGKKRPPFSDEWKKKMSDVKQSKTPEARAASARLGWESRRKNNENRIQTQCKSKRYSEDQSQSSDGTRS